MTTEIAIRALTTAALTGLLLGSGLRLEISQVMSVSGREASWRE